MYVCYYCENNHIDKVGQSSLDWLVWFMCMFCANGMRLCVAGGLKGFGAWWGWGRCWVTGPGLSSVSCWIDFIQWGCWPGGLIDLSPLRQPDTMAGSLNCSSAVLMLDVPFQDTTEHNKTNWVLVYCLELSWWRKLILFFSQFHSLWLGCPKRF